MSLVFSSLTNLPSANMMRAWRQEEIQMSYYIRQVVLLQQSFIGIVPRCTDFHINELNYVRKWMHVGDSHQRLSIMRGHNDLFFSPQIYYTEIDRFWT